MTEIIKATRYVRLNRFIHLYIYSTDFNFIGSITFHALILYFKADIDFSVLILNFKNIDQPYDDISLGGSEKSGNEGLTLGKIFLIFLGNVLGLSSNIVGL